MSREDAGTAALPDGPDALVARVRAGDERALETVFRSHYSPLCDFAARYVRQDALAEELVQDLFADLWARRQELALAVAEKELVADNNPATWEKVYISSALPADADFLIVSMHAIAPADAAPATAFSGDFADLVDCVLYEPMRPSSVAP